MWLLKDISRWKVRHRMQIVIDIPEEQIKKSLEESKYIHEDEGEKGSVDIVMLYTNGHLDFVDVSRKTDFYSCKYKILPKGHGRLIDADALEKKMCDREEELGDDRALWESSAVSVALNMFASTIIEADRSEE